MTDMHIAETSIPTSARPEQGQIKILDSRRNAAVIVCGVVLANAGLTGEVMVSIIPLFDMRLYLSRASFEFRWTGALARCGIGSRAAKIRINSCYQF
ncbi:hypothetical protein N7541_003789 [Penicillium brevicompactum]|uniref:Uncharacterized protein n=1 Tax=Penicillium brevicompactum TaxID=5074 RepID=A0A9W9RMH6_PENBR|nr:hypothetical protein N7541_003789 [Penicillium brevicompactum]